MNIRTLMPRTFNRDIKAVNASPFDLLHQEINDLLEKTFQSFPGTKISPQMPFSPKIDVSETDTAIYIAADLPGIEEEDIKVELHQNLLTIEGTKQAEAEEENKTYYVVERSYGHFRRSITLPYEVDTSTIEATFANGVLKIRIPKPAKPDESKKQIKINKPQT